MFPSTSLCLSVLTLNFQNASWHPGCGETLSPVISLLLILVHFVSLCLQVSGLPGSVFNLAPSHMFGNRLNPNSAMAALIAQSEASPAGMQTSASVYVLVTEVCVCVGEGKESEIMDGSRPLCPSERSRVSSRDIFKLLPLSSSYMPWLLPLSHSLFSLSRKKNKLRTPVFTHASFIENTHSTIKLLPVWEKEEDLSMWWTVPPGTDLLSVVLQRCCCCWGSKRWL